MHQYVLLQIGVVHQFRNRIARPVEQVVALGLPTGTVSALNPVPSDSNKSLHRRIVVTADASVDKLVFLWLARILGNGNCLRRKVSWSGAARPHNLPQRQFAIIREILAFGIVREEPGLPQS